MNQIRAAIARRAFELFESDGANGGREVDHWFQAESELLHPTHLLIAESSDALTVQVEVPGFNANELQVSLEPRRVIVSGRRASSSEQKNKKIVYEEHCCAEIFRTVDLPVDVDTSKTTATLRNGVLELIMPKVAEVKATQVQVKSASRGA